MACPCCVTETCLCQTVAVNCVYTIAVGGYTRSVRCGTTFLLPPMRDTNNGVPIYSSFGREDIRQSVSVIGGEDQVARPNYNSFLEMGMSSCPVSLPFQRTATGFAALFGCDQNNDTRYGICKQLQGCDFEQDSAEDASGRFHIWSYASILRNFLSTSTLQAGPIVVHLWEVTVVSGTPTAQLVWSGYTNRNVFGNPAAIGAGVSAGERCMPCNQSAFVVNSNPPRFSSPVNVIPPFGLPTCPPEDHLGTPVLSIACPP